MCRLSIKSIALIVFSFTTVSNQSFAASDRSAYFGSSSRGSSSPFHLKNWGLSNSQFNSSIRAPEAWRLQEGSRSVVVAIVDTGVDATNPALAKNLWRDKSDSRNDVYGWNFVTNQPNPTDTHGHGTHVAGIIGAMADSTHGISGVVHKVSIMAVKYYSENSPGSVNLKNTIKALNYAIDHGARIINYSGGGPEFSEEEFQAIKRAEAKGILVVAAAGNEHQDTDVYKNYYFPSAYRLFQLNNIISVAATDINNNLIASSNWGKKSVDVAAPGSDIYSTLPNNRFGTMTGTSQATAFVSGLAAMLLSENPKLTPVELKELITNSVDRFPQLQDRVASGGRINAYKALLAVRAATNKNVAATDGPSRSLSGINEAYTPGSLQNFFSDIDAISE